MKTLDICGKNDPFCIIVGDFNIDLRRGSKKVDFHTFARMQNRCPQMLDTASRITRNSRPLIEDEKHSGNFNKFEESN